MSLIPAEAPLADWLASYAREKRMRLPACFGLQRSSRREHPRALTTTATSSSSTRRLHCAWLLLGRSAQASWHRLPCASMPIGCTELAVGSPFVRSANGWAGWSSLPLCKGGPWTSCAAALPCQRAASQQPCLLAFSICSPIFPNTACSPASPS